MIKKVLIVFIIILFLVSIFGTVSILDFNHKNSKISLIENEIIEFDNIYNSKIEEAIDLSEYNLINSQEIMTESNIQNEKECTNIIQEKQEQENIEENEVQIKSSSASKSTNESNNESMTYSDDLKNNNYNCSSQKEWITENHYGGEIVDNSGYSGGYWEYGEELDFNGIDMSDWTIK